MSERDERDRRVARDVDDELALHVDLHVRRLIEAGVPPDEARRRAGARVGAVDRIRAHMIRLERARRRRLRFARAARGVRRDVTAGLRALARGPAFAAAATATVALALGVSASLITIVNALAVRPVPGVRETGLVKLYVSRDGRLDGLSGHSRPAYLAYAEGASSLDAVAAFTGRGLAVEARGVSALVLGQLVSGTFFDVLGTHAARGRLLRPDDDRTDGPAVAVVSHALWTDRLGGDPDVIGAVIDVNARPFRIVGVAEPGFRGPFIGFPSDVFLPLESARQLAPDVDLDSWTDDTLELLGTIAPGLDVRAADADVARLAAQLAHAHPSALARRSVRVRVWNGLDADLEGPVFGFVGVLATVAVLIAGVACANVAGLLLQRGHARRAEFAMRQALGASRTSLVTQLLTEALAVFAAGQALGLGLAAAMTRSLHAFLPDFAIPIELDLAIDWRVWVAVTALTLVSAIVFGLAPGLRGARVDPGLVLRPASATFAPRQARLRRALVAAQFAASFVLVVVAALFTRVLFEAGRLDAGFDMTALATGTADVRVLSRDETAGRAYFEAWLDGARRAPGVRQAALARRLPLAIGAATTAIEADGMPNPPGGHAAASNVVTPGYFAALGMPMLAGRDFSGGDRPTAAPVTIVSRATAVRLFGRPDVVGRHLRAGDRRLRIVGVAGDVAVAQPGRLDDPHYYVPLTQQYSPRMTLVARGAAAPPIDAVLRAARAADPALPLVALSTMEARAGERLFPQRMAAAVAALFGGLGLVLAAVGLYGIVSFQTTARRPELAVRMALGASRATVRRMILTDGLRQAGAGLAAGVVVAALTARVLQSVLPGVPAWDPAAFGLAALALAAVAVLAADLPARRAASTDPRRALNS